MKNRPWSSPSLRFGVTRVRVFWLRVLATSIVGSAMAAALYLGAPRGEVEPRQVSRGATEAVVTPRRTLHGDFPPVSEITYPDLSEPADPKRDALGRRLRESRVSVDFLDRPMDEALVELGSRLGVSIAPDRSGLALIRGSAARVSLKLNEISGRDALKLTLAGSRSLTFVVESSHVRVTDRRLLVEPRRLEIYPVGDLVSQGHHGRYASVGGCKLTELIGLALDDDDHGSMDFTTTDPRHPVDGRLIVFGSHGTHRSVVQTLRFLREGPDQSVERTPAWIEELRKKLDSTAVSMAVNGDSLTETLRAWAEQAGVPVTMDREIDGESLFVSLAVQRLPARSALELIVAQHGLGWNLRNECLVVAPLSSVPAPMTLRIIDLEDLLGAPSPDAVEPTCLNPVSSEPYEPEWLYAMDPDRLTELVRGATDEELWEDPAHLEVHRGQLIVYQTAEMHGRVDRLMAKLRRHQWYRRNPRFQPRPCEER